MVLEVVEHLLVQQQQNQGILSLRHLHRYHHHHSLKVKKTKNIFVQHTFVIIKTTFGIFYIFHFLHPLKNTIRFRLAYVSKEREERTERKEKIFPSKHLNKFLIFIRYKTREFFHLFVLYLYAWAVENPEISEFCVFKKKNSSAYRQTMNR